MKTDIERLTKQFYKLVAEIKATPQDNVYRFTLLKKKMERCAAKLRPLLEAKEKHDK